MARRRRRSGPDGDVWLTVYNDMVTNLMLFFLLLYAMSLLTTEKRDKVVEAIEATFNTAHDGKKDLGGEGGRKETAGDHEDIAHRFAQLGGEVVTVINSQKEVRVTLPSAVLFDVASAKLKDEAVTVLSEIARELRALPNPIIVYGHTDSSPVRGGKYKDNWQLSVARAHTVVRYLSSRQQVAPKRLSVAGVADTRPVAENETLAGRRANRRIEIRILKRGTG
jgi:chemotaxis protein MotB